MEHLGYSRLPVTEIINPVTYLPPFIKPLIIVWQYDVIFKKLHQLIAYAKCSCGRGGRDSGAERD